MLGKRLHQHTASAVLPAFLSKLKSESIRPTAGNPTATHFAGAGQPHGLTSQPSMTLPYVERPFEGPAPLKRFKSSLGAGLPSESIFASQKQLTKPHSREQSDRLESVQGASSIDQTSSVLTEKRSRGRPKTLLGKK